MGVDYVGILVPISRSREEAKLALRQLNDETIINALADTICDPTYDDGLYLWDADNEYKMIGVNRETMFFNLDSIIDSVYDIADGRIRTATWYKIDDVDFVHAGGASWGDTPEWYDELHIAWSLGVTWDMSKRLDWVDQK